MLQITLTATPDKQTLTFGGSPSEASAWMASNMPGVAHEIGPMPQIAQVTAWRTAKEAGGFTYLGKAWQSDALSAQRITGAAVLAMNNPFYSQEWIAADNSTMQLDQSGMLGLFGALGQHVAAVFAQAKTAKDAINAATSIEQIDAVVAGLG